MSESKWVRCSDRLPGDGREYRARYKDIDWHMRVKDGKVQHSASSRQGMGYVSTDDYPWLLAELEWLDEAPAQQCAHQHISINTDACIDCGMSGIDMVVERYERKRGKPAQEGQRNVVPSERNSTTGASPDVPRAATSWQQKVERLGGGSSNVESVKPVDAPGGTAPHLGIPFGYRPRSAIRAQALREVQAQAAAFRREFGGCRGKVG
jgi:hypothetical protein